MDREKIITIICLCILSVGILTSCSVSVGWDEESKSQLRINY